MEITKETELSKLVSQHPWLKEELPKVNDKFKMLNTPMGKIMMGKATITEMSKRSGMDVYNSLEEDSSELIFERV